MCFISVKYVLYIQMFVWYGVSKDREKKFHFSQPVSQKNNLKMCENGQIITLSSEIIPRYWTQKMFLNSNYDFDKATVNAEEFLQIFIDG